MDVRTIVWAWLVAVGVDLFFNAGVFSPLFDQEREPGLLSDSSLATRIPIAYAILAVLVAALWWLLNLTSASSVRQGSAFGAAAGLLLALAGVVWIWTAIEMTALFVGAAVVVQISQMAAAGAVIGFARSGATRAQVRRRSLAFALAAGVAAVVAQNLVA